jgi:hypothetical protein
MTTATHEWLTIAMSRPAPGRARGRVSPAELAAGNKEVTQ